jgi:hypothetical protein
MVNDSVTTLSTGWPRKRDDMPTNISRIVIGSLLLVTAVGIAGCGSDEQEAPGPPVAEINNTINDGTFGRTATVDCADGKGLNIGGSQNTLTVTGRCGSVVIGGDENKITFERVDTEIIVAGLNNTVSYHDGDPQIQDLGTGNTITKD